MDSKPPLFLHYTTIPLVSSDDCLVQHVEFCCKALQLRTAHSSVQQWLPACRSAAIYQRPAAYMQACIEPRPTQTGTSSTPQQGPARQQCPWPPYAPILPVSQHTGQQAGCVGTTHRNERCNWAQAKSRLAFDTRPYQLQLKTESSSCSARWPSHTNANTPLARTSTASSMSGTHAHVPPGSCAAWVHVTNVSMYPTKQLAQCCLVLPGSP